MEPDSDTIEVTPEASGRIPEAIIPGRCVMAAYVDDDGGLLLVEYPGEKLPADLAASIMANLIADTLGPEPTLPDVMMMQQTLVATLKGGESAGKKTK